MRVRWDGLRSAKGKHKCACLDGYALEADNFTCKSVDNGSAPHIIFSNRHELRGIDLHTFNVKALISNLKNTVNTLSLTTTTTV